MKKDQGTEMIEERLVAAGYAGAVIVVEEEGPLLRVDYEGGTLTVHLLRMLVDEAPPEVAEAGALHELAHLHLGHPARRRRRRAILKAIQAGGCAVTGFILVMVFPGMPAPSFLGWVALVLTGLVSATVLVMVLQLFDVRGCGVEALEADAPGTGGGAW